MLMLKSNPHENSYTDFDLHELPSTKKLNPAVKQSIALDALRGEQVTKVARKYGVSRTCVYRHKRRALEVVEQAFAQENTQQTGVVFSVHFTPATIARTVLAMFLCGKSSYRSIQRIFEDIFDYQISLGKISNIVRKASAKAQ